MYLEAESKTGNSTLMGRTNWGLQSLSSQLHTGSSLVTQDSAKQSWNQTQNPDKLQQNIYAQTVPFFL